MSLYAGDLSREIDRRVKERVKEFTGNPDYKFGDLTKEILNRQKDRLKDFMGEKAMENYQFGDFTKALGRKVTGDENYKVRLLLNSKDVVLCGCPCVFSHWLCLLHKKIVVW